MTKGSTTEVNAEFPNDYYHPQLAGKKTLFKVTIQDIKEMVLPEIFDYFILRRLASILLYSLVCSFIYKLWFFVQFL